MPSMPSTNIMGWVLTREAQEHPITGMQKAGVIIVVVLAGFFVLMILLDAFGVINEDVSNYAWGLVVIVGIVASGLFAGSIKAWPTWSP